MTDVTGWILLGQSRGPTMVLEVGGVRYMPLWGKMRLALDPTFGEDRNEEVAGG